MATSHSTIVCWFSAARVCACIDTVRVCTGYGFPQYRYVFRSTGYGLQQHVCVCWQFCSTVSVLVMVSCEHVLTWLTVARL